MAKTKKNVEWAEGRRAEGRKSAQTIQVFVVVFLFFSWNLSIRLVNLHKQHYIAYKHKHKHMAYTIRQAHTTNTRTSRKITKEFESTKREWKLKKRKKNSTMKEIRIEYNETTTLIRRHRGKNRANFSWEPKQSKHFVLVGSDTWH